MRRCLTIWCWLLPIAAHAAPHQLGQSYLFLSIYGDGIEGRVEITTLDLNRALGLGWETDDRLTKEALAAHRPQIEAYVREHLQISTDETMLSLTFSELETRNIEIAQYVLVPFVVTNVKDPPRYLDVTFSMLFEVSTTHRNMLVIENNWYTGTLGSEEPALIFSPSTLRQRLDLSTASVWRGFLSFVKLGIWHIWIGVDHILFLMALVLPAVLRREDGVWQPVPRFRTAFLNILVIVSFFTIAHSITLALAALQIIVLPSRFVEVVIAASIAVAALHNLYPILSGREWLIALVFGLFHGFGFANVLVEIGLERGPLVVSLLGFNVGVELGQIAIIAVVFPFFFALRRWPGYTRIVLRFGSMLLVLVALFWFIERAFDLPLSKSLDRYLRYAQKLLFK